MGDYSPGQLQQALRPIESLIGKSDKAQRKLAQGTWQHTMLQDNLEALRIAAALMTARASDAPVFSAEDLTKTLATLTSLAVRVEQTEAKSAPGTSQHALQRNRLAALRIAQAVVREELG